MSVRFAEQVRDKLRTRGITVHENYTDWRNNGTGQATDFQGGIMHHTATAYGDAFPVLVNGRPDLPGPIANSSGNADGSVTLIAAGTANHAGAAGGSWARPFPDTGSFNHMVWGHEIVYPGTKPMRDEQWNTMVALGQVICEILGKGPEWIRGHYETSVTGKWDPGYAPGKWINMDDVRAEIGGDSVGGDDMFEEADRALVDTLRHQLTGSAKEGEYPGHPSFVEGSEARLTVLDYVRNIHARSYRLLQQSRKQEAVIKELADLAGNSAGAEGDEIVQQINTVIAEEVRPVELNIDVSERTS